MRDLPHTKVPCKDCQFREPGCHGKCEMYRDWREELTAVRQSDMCCQNCRLLCNDYGLKRARCAYTGEIIADPEYMLGKDCPIEFEKEES